MNISGCPVKCEIKIPENWIGFDLLQSSDQKVDAKINAIIGRNVDGSEVESREEWVSFFRDKIAFFRDSGAWFFGSSSRMFSSLFWATLSVGPFTLPDGLSVDGILGFLEGVPGATSEFRIDDVYGVKIIDSGQVSKVDSSHGKHFSELRKYVISYILAKSDAAVDFPGALVSFEIIARGEWGSSGFEGFCDEVAAGLRWDVKGTSGGCS